MTTLLPCNDLNSTLMHPIQRVFDRDAKCSGHAFYNPTGEGGVESNIVIIMLMLLMLVLLMPLMLVMQM